MGFFKEKRTGIIVAVGSILGLLALIFLILESLLFFQTNKATGADFSHLVWGTIGAFIFAIAIVGGIGAALARYRPDLFQPSRAGEPLPNPELIASPADPPISILAGFWIGHLRLENDRNTVINCNLHVTLLSNQKICAVLRYEGRLLGTPTYRGADILLEGSEESCSPVSWKPHFERWSHQVMKKLETVQASRAYAWDCSISNGKVPKIEVKIRADSEDPIARDFEGWLVKQ